VVPSRNGGWFEGELADCVVNLRLLHLIFSGVEVVGLEGAVEGASVGCCSESCRWTTLLPLCGDGVEVNV